MSDGTIFLGTNVENAAYPSGMCAERTALYGLSTVKDKNVTTIAIIAKPKEPKEGITKEVTAPCGSCRQVIFEFSQIANVDIEIIMSTTNMDKIIIATISELLPLAFGPNDLK